MFTEEVAEAGIGFFKHLSSIENVRHWQNYVGRFWRWKASTNIAHLPRRPLFAVKMGQMSFEDCLNEHSVSNTCFSFSRTTTFQRRFNLCAFPLELFTNKDVLNMIIKQAKALSKGSLELPKRGHVTLCGANKKRLCGANKKRICGANKKRLCHFGFNQIPTFPPIYNLFHLFPNFPDTFSLQWVYFATFNSRYFMKLSQTEQSWRK